jgi:endo-1,3-1,4-beta-glycanase ExoK
MKKLWTVTVVAAACLCSGAVDAKPYKGAEVYSRAQYLYGRVEVRMRMARGEGILSTFFTYKQGSEVAGALWEEIDMEVLGKSGATTWQSNILTGNPRMGSERVHNAGVSLADDYHTYTVEWAPTYVAWRFDDVEVRRTSGGQATQLTSPQGLRFNLWASDASSWAGVFAASALPQYQHVDWIRYYRYENDTFVLDWTDDFDTFDSVRWARANWTFDGNLADLDPSNAVVREGNLVLCMTEEGQTGCSGTVPAPDGGGTGGSAGDGSAAGTGDGDGGCGCGVTADGTATAPPLLGFVVMVLLRRRRARNT